MEEVEEDEDAMLLALGIRDGGGSWVGAGIKEKLALGIREGVERGVELATCGVDSGLLNATGWRVGRGI